MAISGHHSPFILHSYWARGEARLHTALACCAGGFHPGTPEKGGGAQFIRWECDASEPDCVSAFYACAAFFTFLNLISTVLPTALAAFINVSS